MRPIIFLGPSLGRAKAEQLIDAEFRPPAARGDIIRAVARNPSAIGLIDGYFKDVPSVWHKEILWAIYSGIPVFGAASIGALRAAELADYGMIGIGAIFEGFRLGNFNRDDEVAIVHGPSELDFMSLSEALVNIRATIESLVERDLLSVKIADHLIKIAQEIFYPDRSFIELCRRGVNEGVLLNGNMYLDLLIANRIDLKAMDSVELLEVIKTPNFSNLAPSIEWNFEWTEAWDIVYWDSIT